MNKRPVSYSFDFALKDRVKVIAISVIGTVDGLMATNDGTQYRTLYWINGDRKSQWLYAEELEAA